MATVTFSPLIADIRGKTADVVFSSWKGRNYIRQRVIPANPRTADQTAVRDSLAEAVAIWQQLPGALQDGYGNAAANLNISGYNDFVGRNRALIQAETGLNGPRRNTDASGDRIEVPTDFTDGGEPGAGQRTFSWTDPGQGADYRFGYLCYDSTGNVIFQTVVDVGLLSLGGYTVPLLTVGQWYLIAFWVLRLTDSEYVHMGASGWIQTT